MTPDPNSLEACLVPARFVDSDSPIVRDYAERAVGKTTDPRERAVRLFYTVRDGLRYNPYAIVPDPECFRASYVARQTEGFCIPKAILLAATARALEIPARLRFADVRNHLTTPQLQAYMGTDVFVFHGYTELFLGARWVKATPTFNIELCKRFGVRPLEFDGRSDAIFHELDAEGRRHMEYVRDRGPYVDLPYDELFEVFRETYAGHAASISEREHDPFFDGGK